MKILVFGRSGQVANELAKYPETICLGRADADFTDPEICAAIVQKTDADRIVIAAAYTAVDKAENQQNLAKTVNAVSPGAIARAAAMRDIPLIYISTDYVLNSDGNDFQPTDTTPRPKNVYGRTKLNGELSIANAGGRYVILRTSWVFSDRGSNFVKTILRIAGENHEIAIVDDQIGGPTAAADIASAIMKIAIESKWNRESNGIFHFAGTPTVSWALFAREIISQAGIDCKVIPIPTSDYPLPANRPLNSRLDCSRAQAVFQIEQPDWRKSLSVVFKSIGGI